MKTKIRIFYLYLFSLIGLVIVVMGSVRLVNTGLETFIFKEANQSIYPMRLENPENKAVIEYNEKANQKSQLHRELAQALSQIIVGAPLYLYHWKIVQKESSKNKS